MPRHSSGLPQNEEDEKTNAFACAAMHGGNHRQPLRLGKNQQVGHARNLVVTAFAMSGDKLAMLSMAVVYFCPPHEDALAAQRGPFFLRRVHSGRGIAPEDPLPPHNWMRRHQLRFSHRQERPRFDLVVSRLVSRRNRQRTLDSFLRFLPGTKPCPPIQSNISPTDRNWGSRWRIRSKSSQSLPLTLHEV